MMNPRLCLPDVDAAIWPSPPTFFVPARGTGTSRAVLGPLADNASIRGKSSSCSRLYTRGRAGFGAFWTAPRRSAIVGRPCGRTRRRRFAEPAGSVPQRGKRLVDVVRGEPPGIVELGDHGSHEGL